MLIVLLTILLSLLFVACGSDKVAQVSYDACLVTASSKNMLCGQVTSGRVVTQASCDSLLNAFKQSPMAGAFPGLSVGATTGCPAGDVANCSQTDSVLGSVDLRFYQAGLNVFLCPQP